MMYNNNKDRNIIVEEMLHRVETRLKTIMIGILARFEDRFGYLWNQDGDPNTEQEIFFQDLWESTRTEILNHGHNQIRQSQEEVSELLDRAERHTIKFYFNK